MELPLFDEVTDLVQSMAPAELGELKTRSHRRGVKLWFDSEKPGREHYEAQLLARRHVDGRDGMAIEVGFHAEHRDANDNKVIEATLAGAEAMWREQLGPEAELGPFFGADNWRRLSESWIEPDLDDPQLAWELAARLVDYIAAIEPLRQENHCSTSST